MGKYSFEKILSIARENPRYIVAGFIFFTLFCYQFLEVPKFDEEKREQKESDPTPALESHKPEVVYENIFQSKDGDIFRLGFRTRVDYKQNVSILLRNPLNEILEIQQIEILPNDDWQYKEIIFFAPGRYDSISIRLKDNPTRPEEWDNKKVFIDSLFITPLDISEAKISTLQPTIFGVGKLKHSRIEDLGNTLLYTFSLQGKKSDYEGLDNKTKSIRFDTKEDRVVGTRVPGEHFIYRFDTIFPFEKMVIQVERKGKLQDGVRIEYSYDKAFWIEIPSPTDLEGPYKLTQMIPGSDNKHEVFLRVIYKGEEKKSGSFSLQELTAVALLKKTK